MKKPPRLYQRGPSWYHVSRSGQWTKLADNLEESIRLWPAVERGNLDKFGAVIDRYLKLIPSLDLAPATVRSYRRQCERLRKVFGKMPPNKLTPVHIGTYLDTNPSPVSANRDIAVMSVICGYALRWGSMERNPCLGIKRNKERRRTRYVTPDERVLLATAAGRHALTLDLAYLTAARRADLLKLTQDDALAHGLRITHGKTGINQLVLWSPRLKAVVEAMGENHLICTTAGKGYTLSGWDSIWRRIRERAGLPDVHFHDLRGTALTDIEANRGIEAAKLTAGHANLAMTEAYVRSRAVLTVEPTA